MKKRPDESTDKAGQTGHHDLTSDDHESDPRAVMLGNLTVTRLTLADLPQLGRIRSVVPLFEPGIGLAFPPNDFWKSMTAAAFGRSNLAVLLARTGGRVVGLARYRIHAADRRWQLDLLASETGVYDPAPVWRALIQEGIRQAGVSGSKRLYAVAERNSSVWRALTEDHYLPYAQETVMMARYPVSEGRSSAVRSQLPSDTWAIHQLYNAVVPREVQQAEALTSHEWEMQSGFGSTRSLPAGWIVDHDHQVIGYCRVVDRSAGKLLELLVAPGESGVGGELVDQAVSTLAGSGSAAPLYCSVRGYQLELIAMLETRNFRAMVDQDLLVRYTTVQPRVPLHERSYSLWEIGSKVPRRSARPLPKEA